MTRSDFKKESRGKKEELKYPCSPRSQKWINNLLPVLESYNYNYSDIIKLVKNCDYNADKIQIEVERIMQMKLGHEQGEWEVVRPNIKNDKNTTKNQTSTHGNYTSNGKFKGKNMNKDNRDKKFYKSSPKSRLDNKIEKVDENEEKKELFTSWASLLKRDSINSSSNLTSTNLGSSNLSNNSNVGSGITQGQTVESLSSLTEQTRLNEQNRLNERIVEKTGKVRPAVVMPKEFDYSESRLTFGCLEDELWNKPWSDWRQFQKPRNNRLQADVFPNFYDRKSFYFDDQNSKKFDRFQPTNNTNLPVTTSNTNDPRSLTTGNLTNTRTDTNLTSTNIGTSTISTNPNLTTGNMGQTNLSTSNMTPAGLSTNNMTGKDGVYFSYPYSNERLQNPPGLSYYTPQPFYAFGNNNSGNVTSMWQN